MRIAMVMAATMVLLRYAYLEESFNGFDVV
jgi:hypothetical protein